MILKLIAIGNILIFVESFVKNVSNDEQTKQFWRENGHNDLLKKLKEIKNNNMAKNIIIFIGDGMGPSTIAAARIYKNQRMVNSLLPDVGLSFDSFANAGAVKTHSVDDYVADSSSTATAILTGVKTRSQVVGVGPNVYFKNCSSHSKTDNLVSIGTGFFEQKKSVGIVTTTRITHATPASLYANIASRDWEYEVPENCSIEDIALQLFNKAEQFQVLLGGGMNYFLPESMKGKRKDGRNLLAEWNNKMKRFSSALVTNSTSFRNIEPSKIEYLFGLLGENHLKYDPFREDQPSIEELTDVAIKVLSKNKNGYFLLVEGGKIDLAHHQNKAVLAILETLAFEKAVEKAVNSTSFDDTLILVTADHSHVFTVGSYAHRNVDITKKNQAYFGYEKDKKGHTSLLYSNGPGYVSPRENITDQTKFALNHTYSSGVPLNDETHGGEDLVVYAEGPWSHLINGLHQQSYIYYVMMYASCTGEYKDSMHCLKSSSTSLSFTTWWFIFYIVLISGKFST